MKATKAKKSAVEAPETNEEKQKALDAAISYITKSYGKGSIMKLGQNTAMNVSAIPTGSLTLDLALGIGGVPRGRIVEVFGPESSGKNNGIALHIAAEAQKPAGLRRLSMLSTRLTRFTQRLSGWTLTICLFPSPTAESRHLR